MNTNQIKLILMNYSEDEYVPELGGIYMQGKIVVRANDLHPFIRKHDIGLCNYVFTSFVFEGEIKTMRKLVFYMNLLNFNGYSSWQIMLTSIKFKSINRILHYSARVKSQKYIIYRKV